jgi:hypothetical protein
VLASRAAIPFNGRAPQLFAFPSDEGELIRLATLARCSGRAYKLTFQERVACVIGVRSQFSELPAGQSIIGELGVTRPM